MDNTIDIYERSDAYTKSLVETRVALDREAVAAQARAAAKYEAEKTVAAAAKSRHGWPSRTRRSISQRKPSAGSAGMCAWLSTRRSRACMRQCTPLQRAELKSGTARGRFWSIACRGRETAGHGARASSRSAPVYGRFRDRAPEVSASTASLTCRFQYS